MTSRGSSSPLPRAPDRDMQGLPEKTLVEQVEICTPKPAASYASSSARPTFQQPYNQKTKADKLQDEEVKDSLTRRRKTPAPWRPFLHAWQVLAALSTFIFQACASPYSKSDPPFASRSLIYFTYTAIWASFVWSTFMIYVYITRRMGSGGKVKHGVSFAVNTIQAIILGVLVCFEIGEYKCLPGAFDGWCDFFNTGLFFGVVLFVGYIILALWDFFAGLNFLRQ